MSTHLVRTTLALPADLLEAADNAVRDGKARSRNALVAAALRRELAAQERAAIDAAFAAMADDREYQAEALAIEAEFANSGVEALQLTEAER
jgi:metal-responsive CopG/Arc/MetJ family transcriptional regulator